MIKLIITDMDGTLLNSNKQLSAELITALNLLIQQEIRLVIASGRQYYNLREFFPEQDKISSYISENGALIFENGKNIYSAKMHENHIHEILKCVRRTKNVYPVCCGINGAYIENDDPLFLHNVQMYYKKLELISDLTQIKNDTICKLAVFDSKNAETNVYHALREFDYMQVTLSGINWVDVTEPDINKGYALKILQNKYNISPNECMAFGDYLNDLEMMQLCKYSYAMANAHPQLKEICRYETASNDDNGVLKAIRLYFDV